MILALGGAFRSISDGVFLDLRPSVLYRPSDLLALGFTAADGLLAAAPAPLACPSRMFGPLARPSDSARRRPSNSLSNTKIQKQTACRRSDVQFNGWSIERMGSMGSRADQHFNPSAHSPPPSIWLFLIRIQAPNWGSIKNITSPLRNFVCHKLRLSYPYVLQPWCLRPLIFRNFNYSLFWSREKEQTLLKVNSQAYMQLLLVRLKSEW